MPKCQSHIGWSFHYFHYHLSYLLLLFLVQILLHCASIPIIGYIIWILVYPIFYLKVLFPYSLHFLTPWLIVWETKISHMIRYLVFLNYFPGVTYLRKLEILILLCHICFLHCKAAIENVGFNIRDEK